MCVCVCGTNTSLLPLDYTRWNSNNYYKVHGLLASCVVGPRRQCVSVSPRVGLIAGGGGREAVCKLCHLEGEGQGPFLHGREAVAEGEAPLFLFFCRLHEL